MDTEDRAERPEPPIYYGEVEPLNVVMEEREPPEPEWGC